MGPEPHARSGCTPRPAHRCVQPPGASPNLPGDWGLAVSTKPMVPRLVPLSAGPVLKLSAPPATSHLANVQKQIYARILGALCHERNKGQIFIFYFTGGSVCSPCVESGTHYLLHMTVHLWHTHTHTHTCALRTHVHTYLHTHAPHMHVHTRAHTTHTRAHPRVYTHATHVYEHIHTT